MSARNSLNLRQFAKVGDSLDSNYNFRPILVFTDSYARRLRFKVKWLCTHGALFAAKQSVAYVYIYGTIANVLLGWRQPDKAIGIVLSGAAKQHLAKSLAFLLAIAWYF